MPNRTISRAHLIALDLPPTCQRDVDDRSEVHLDEHVRALSYTQIRRMVFTFSDGFTYAVEYEAPLDTGDFEVSGGPVEHHGWGETVTAVEVELRPVAVNCWMPVPEDGPSPDGGFDPVFHQLTETFVETGCREDTARDGAAELLADHARELAVFLADRHPQAAYELQGHARDLTAGIDKAAGRNAGVDLDEDDEPENYDETDSDNDVFALIAGIALRLQDATEDGEHQAANLIYDLANGRKTLAEARADLAEITLRHA